MKVHILLEAKSYNFYWCEKKYKYEDGTPMLCYWEDIFYTVVINNKELKKEFITIDSKSYIQFEIDELEGEYGTKMELDFPGYIDRKLNDSCFGLPQKEVVNSKNILIGYCYDDFDDPELYELDLYNLPTNEYGVKPSHIIGYVPTDSISRKEVQEFMKLLISKHYDIQEPIEFSFEWINIHNDIEEQWNKHLEEIKEWNKMKEDGKSLSIRYSILFMEQLFGTEIIEKYIDQGLLYGEPIGDEIDQVLLTFDDGHTEILNNNDFETDHFN